jgi:hypothetical protein
MYFFHRVKKELAGLIAISTGARDSIDFSLANKAQSVIIKIVANQYVKKRNIFKQPKRLSNLFSFYGIFGRKLNKCSIYGAFPYLKLQPYISIESKITKKIIGNRYYNKFYILLKYKCLNWVDSFYFFAPEPTLYKIRKIIDKAVNLMKKEKYITKHVHLELYVDWAIKQKGWLNKIYESIRNDVKKAHIILLMERMIIWLRRLWANKEFKWNTRFQPWGKPTAKLFTLILNNRNKKLEMVSRWIATRWYLKKFDSRGRVILRLSTYWLKKYEEGYHKWGRSLRPIYYPPEYIRIVQSRIRKLDNAKTY